MSKFTDNIAFNTRLYSAISAVIAIGSIAIWAYISTSPVVSSETVYATIIEISARPEGSNVQQFKFKLENGKVLKVFSTKNIAPQSGNKIPLILETYKNGEKQYYIDYAKLREQQLYR